MSNKRIHVFNIRIASLSVASSQGNKHSTQENYDKAV